MIPQEFFVEIHVLHRQGLSIRAIARKLNISRNTVKRYLRDPKQTPEYSQRAKRPSVLDPFKPYLLERIRAASPDWIPATVLFREIKARGYEGGKTTVRSFVSAQRPQKLEVPIQRFETLPGEQLQVDFTTIRGGRYPLKAFVATMGYSRASYVCFTTSEKQEDWLEGIEAALHFFGGVPKEILFDNAKCVILQRDAYGIGRHQWNPALLALSKQYGFKCEVCKPYRAQTKGKVERFNRYLKESFITPLTTSLRQAGLTLTEATANAHIGPWILEVANQRIHATTLEKPAIRLEEERAQFLPLPTSELPSSIEHALYSKALTPMIAPPVEGFQHPLSVYDQLVGGSL